ncbi:Sec-independent protein translocase protein tatB-like protein [Thiorhodococcus drewsii AZ1]|uniref:Sec-independent protein translocase protein TatB n=1 Tax=Thiorhodococcus drewsii AZ1 TaxID=765913 RepID=G2E214_9GAMM|nr:Sec-independent protein translocase protein TatB [Thiorhodococcus drewsii]EGV30963.1 Sec-independent protein translocase protein tatB-like protein [Thiorhodococcus drewsii AZ1]
MFDIGFTELLLIGVVALVVLGPERLPKVARVAGMWVGKARRTLTSVKQEIDRELKAEELKSILERQAQIDPLESILEEPPKTTSSQSTPNAKPSPAKPEPPPHD